MKKSAIFSVVVLTFTAACGSSGGDSETDDAVVSGDSVAVPTAGDGATETDESLPEEPAFSDAVDLGPFCDAYGQIPTDTPEGYVGSTEHLADIDELVAVTPDAIATDLDDFRDYVASGAIDATADPESTVAENWPIEVQESVFRVVTYGTNNC